MRPFAIVEVMLVVCLGIALIVQQPANRVAAVEAPKAMSKTSFGPSRRMGDGVVRSYVQTDDGKPIAIGVALTDSALFGLPLTGDRGNSCCANEIVLKLPEGIAVAPFTHIAVNWNPKGHAPEGIYDKPHFDFHFYTMDEDARLKIAGDGVELEKAPPSEFIPAGHIATPGVMKMGVHWVDPQSPEFHGQPFTKTFMYGAYNGQVTFVEPMITKEYLESHPDQIEAIKQPKAYASGYFPSSYAVRYDPATHEYAVALTQLVRH